MVHPYNTNFLTSLSNQACSMTISRKAPSGNLTSELTSTVLKWQSTLQESSSGPWRYLSRSSSSLKNPSEELSWPRSEIMPNQCAEACSD